MLLIKIISCIFNLLFLVLSLAISSNAVERSSTLSIIPLTKSANSTEIIKILDERNISDNLKTESSNEDIENDYDDENEDDDDDEDDDAAAAAHRTKHTRRKHISIIKRVGTTYVWDRWEKWTKCSNSCVQIRRRKCIERKLTSLDAAPVDREFYPDPNNPLGCQGVIKRYRHCKDEKCKANKKRQRDEQCAAFNRIPFKEKYFNWLGYEKEHNECELFCRPSGSGVFMSMNQSVTDGTTCGRPAVYYTHYYRRKAVCVEGICRVSKALDSSKQ
ncbi:unnamed protein product [Ceratitis capitata]|uniref:(Mediterranean fruit fly) hypothetical protein n=1 Tax=Ceratitis capitata TaxID=7213 RepID=A0A811UFM4_CERCA|nr:unnamed protein product [Ceratitis capitata]